VGQSGFGKIEHRVDVGGEGPLPFLVGNVLQRPESHLVGSVVYQHIDPAEGVGSLVDNRPAMRRIADIAAHQGAFASGFFDPFLRFLRVVILAQIGYQHIRAFAREGDCDRATDPAVTAGDDDPLPFETAGALVAFFAVIGLGVH